MQNKCPVYKLAYERAQELYEQDKKFWESIENALYTAFEEIMDECECYMRDLP